MKKINNKWTAVTSIVIVALLFSCHPDDGLGDGNGLKTDGLASSFTVTPIPNSSNRFLLTADASQALGLKWNKGDGNYNFGLATDSLFLPDIGTYTVGLSVIGKGGEVAQSTQNVSITTADPIAGNLVLGARFDTPDDISKWTVLKISASGAAWNFGNGVATVTGSGYNQQGIYQAINVVAGNTYKIDLLASSTTGLTDTWFEVYCSTTAPAQGQDYTAGGIKRNINTWDGCGKSAFSGKVSVIGCNSSKNGGTFTATTTGVMYLVIKCGGGSANVSIDNVEVRRK